MQLFSSLDFNPKVGIGKAVIQKEFFWIRVDDQCKLLAASLSLLALALMTTGPASRKSQ